MDLLSFSDALKQWWQGISRKARRNLPEWQDRDITACYRAFEKAKKSVFWDEPAEDLFALLEKSLFERKSAGNIYAIKARMLNPMTFESLLREEQEKKAKIERTKVNNQAMQNSYIDFIVDDLLPQEPPITEDEFEDMWQTVLENKFIHSFPESTKTELKTYYKTKLTT